MAKFTFIDLFSGIGGFRIALNSIGGNCVGFSEIASDAINAYCSNFNEEPNKNLGDITKLSNLPKHDLLTAGVPCQSWSIAGKNLGFDDDRGQLWNDTLYLLNQAKPKAFIFENVKGLSDPRNEKALQYILDRIKQAGYYAEKFILDASEYGVPQTRVRIYIIGFLESKYYKRFHLPKPFKTNFCLGDILDDSEKLTITSHDKKPKQSLSCNELGFNDYFLFNDLRNGDTTIHSWDIIDTTAKEKEICLLLLRNRRKKKYGVLDGNPLSVEHFKELSSIITKDDLDKLVEKEILKKIKYSYLICEQSAKSISSDEKYILSCNKDNIIIVDTLKDKYIKKKNIKIEECLDNLEKNGFIKCIEERYDFKNTKISTGLNGINRIFLPSSKIYPTLVASDTNDFVSTKQIYATTPMEWKHQFINQIFKANNYRKITKSEACKIQGFPVDFILPDSRPKWMHLIGNSVAIPIIKMLSTSIIKTGIFDENDWDGHTEKLIV